MDAMQMDRLAKGSGPAPGPEDDARTNDGESDA